MGLEGMGVRAQLWAGAAGECFSNTDCCGCISARVDAASSVCVHVFIYTHTHILTSTRVHDQNTSISPPHAFLQAAKIQKNKIKFLIIAKSSETNITSTGQVFFFP